GPWLFILLGAPLLGLRHATDPDHLVAVTALVSGDGAGPRAAQRLGVAWGCGHAAVLLAAGVPLIALDAQLPAGLERAAEAMIGVVIVVLALRVLLRLRRRPPTGAHANLPSRSARRAAAIGVLHGLGGSGAIALLLATKLPTTAEAITALALFAPMSVVSMAICTRAYAHALARPALARATPALAVFSLAFGAWYAL
ncbi:MAG TPA: hypothetical protein VFZ89_13980, partial [Solirubrobacteraceae bacterium]